MMKPDENSAQADSLSYDQTTPLAPESLMPESLPPDSEPAPAPLTEADFDPVTVAINRMQKSGSAYAKRTKIAATSDELCKISAMLVNTLGSDEQMEFILRTQSALINQAFITLLMKATQDDSFDDAAFSSALRAQRQYRITIQALSRIKNAEEQTEMKRQKVLSASRPRDRFADPYAHQYSGV